jgi:hypothetical protein
MSYVRLNPTETTCSINNKNTTNFTFVDDSTKITRSGRMVQLSLMADAISPVSTWTDVRICNVTPAPSMKVFGEVRDNYGNTTAIQISTNGDVLFRTLGVATQAGYGFRGSFVYLA